MKRRVVVLAALACIAAAADPADQLTNPGQEARARALFVQIRCVVCQNESIDDSEAPLARDLRQAVRAQVSQGRTDGQIRDFLVRRYGEFVLLRPTFSIANAVAWLAPFAILLAGGVGLVWRSRRSPPKADELTPEEEARLAGLMKP